nr:hypothetical protein [Tanacetum cinerariifolium]
MASAVICLSSGRKFIFSKYIFDSLVQPTPSQSPQVQPPSPQPQPQQDAGIPMHLLQEVMDTCAALTRRVKHLEFDKVAQALEIIKLKRRVKKLERRNKGRMITEVDADAVLEDDKEVADEAKEVAEDAKADKTKPAEVQEVVDVVTVAKLITEVVTAANETITVASPNIPAAEARVHAVTLTAAPARVTAAPSRKRKGVVTRDLQEESTTSIIIPAETKSKDNGKEILVEEPKPLKKKQQIKQDEQYARELQAKLNKNIDWDEAIDHVKQKAKEDPAVKRYQVLKRNPQTKAQARNNMMVYLKNVAGFKMDYFKGMSYDYICPIFEAKFNTNVAFLLKTKEQIEEDENRALKRLNETPAEKAAKSLVKERFSTTKPKNFSDDFLLVTLGAMFKKPDIHAQIWKNQRSVYGTAKVKGWKLLESCGVQIITFITTQLILLVERKYPLTRFTLDQTLNAIRLEVEEESEVSLELLRWPPRVTLGRLLPHARGLGFKPRRGGFPSGAKKEWGLSPKAKVRVLYTAQLDVTVKEYQENDRIRSKPDKNGKRGEAGKSLKQLQLKEEEKPKKTKKRMAENAYT